MPSVAELTGPRGAAPGRGGDARAESALESVGRPPAGALTHSAASRRQRRTRTLPLTRHLSDTRHDQGMAQQNVIAHLYIVDCVHAI